MDDALISLRQHFGFDGFRAGQTEVINAILEGKDAVVVMPTGSGKSLCYQLPAMMLSGATLLLPGSITFCIIRPMRVCMSMAGAV